MNISFEKTDRLINVLANCHYAVNFDYCEDIFCLIKENPQNGLYNSLIEIANSDKSEEEKHTERLKVFESQGFNEQLLNDYFNEEYLLKLIDRTYWELQTLLYEDHPAYLWKRQKFDYFNENDIAIIKKIRLEGIPQLKDVENEFLTNCTDISMINDFCTIYKKRISEFPRIERNGYSYNGKEVLKTLRECGLICSSKNEIESKLASIDWDMGTVNNELNILFNKLLPPVQQTIQPQQTSQYKITKDRTTDFIKLVSAMYDCRIFETIDGKVASNKKDLIKTLTGFFNAEITDYSSLLSAAKTTSNYLDIFDKIKEKGDAYYNKPPKK